jgi:hypothetical protein
VIIDEIHAFAGDDRGWHLLAVLERVGRLAGRELQRIGLSATVGNPEQLLEWLAGHCEGSRRVIQPSGPTGSTEMDVQLTADGHLAVFHDSHTKGLKCPMLIAQHTMDNLRGCEKTMLTVDEAIAIGWPAGSVISLDVKLHKNDLGYKGRLADSLAILPAKYPEMRILIESPDTAFLRLLIDRGVTQGLYLYTSAPDDAQRVAVPMGLEGLSIRNEYISKEQVKASQRAGIRVMLWGVGTRHHNRQALLKGPDLIQSDRLAHMVRLAQKAAHSR